MYGQFSLTEYWSTNPGTYLGNGQWSDATGAGVLAQQASQRTFADVDGNSLDGT
mgnify:CR=1 FL=1